MPSSFLRLLQLLAFVAAVQLAAPFANASTIYYWPGYNNSRHGTALQACRSFNPVSNAYNVTTTSATCGTSVNNSTSCNSGCWTIYRSAVSCPYGDNGTYQCNDSCPAPKEMVNGQCVAPTCPGDSTWNGSACELSCISPAIPDPETNTCKTPPQCPEGSFWDFDENRCAYPQDDYCGSIGAQWDPAKQQCQCAAGKTLSQDGDMRACLDDAPDQECTKDSPDFSGYIDQTAICAGRNRCPNGGKPGFVDTGDGMKAVCVGGTDPNCPGGQGGNFNGEHVCVYDPDEDDPRCAPGETAGYVGPGDNPRFVCVPKNYLPETCPPGQYAWNTGTGGFACVTSSDKPPATDESGNPKAPGTVTGTIGGTTGGTGEGGETGEQKIELDFSTLIEEAPKDNYFKDMQEFSESALEFVDPDELAAEFSGPNGAFTQRSSLDNASNFIKQHTIGNSTTCSGAMPFFGYTVSCEKLANMNRILGWILFVYTAIGIYQVIMRPSASGV